MILSVSESQVDLMKMNDLTPVSEISEVYGFLCKIGTSPLGFLDS